MVPEGAGKGGPEISAQHRPPGIRCHDPIEGGQFVLFTPDEVDLHPADPDGFYFPVETAVRADATAIETTKLLDVWVRDEEGDLVAEYSGVGERSVSLGTYHVELSSTQMKTYLRVDGGFDISRQGDRIRFEFTPGTDLQLGVRSFHERPAATITVPGDPEPLADALSHLGSALKTTSPERSFPTLRGYPPLFERGDRLHVPEPVERPDTDVTLVVGPDLSQLYPVASLAYYFGATVETGGSPRLVAGDESYPLDTGESFESRVAKVLQHAFLLDCVTRTEGYYRVDLHERRLVEEAVDLDFAALYDAPLSERLRTYLSVPFDDVEHALPRWKLTADVVPSADHLDVLPHLANELAVVRCPEELQVRYDRVSTSTVAATAVGEDFTRSAGRTTRGIPEGAEPRFEVDRPLVYLPEADSIEHAYVGEGFPVGACKTSAEAYERRLNRSPRDDPRIRVTVVNNNERMDDENVVRDRYGVREHIDFDVSLAENTTTEELASIFERERDFVHYIGHTDERGLECADGFLDARSLSTVNTGAFLLNSCHSFAQGEALVDRGAIGGIVTLEEVMNAVATDVGKMFARLLNAGHSLSTALSVLPKENRLARRQYMIVGDGNVSIVDTDSGTLEHVRINRSGSKYSVEIDLYPSTRYPLGTMYTPYIKDDTSHTLNSGSIKYDVDIYEIQQSLDLESRPVTIGRELYWSDEISIETIRDLQ